MILWNVKNQILTMTTNLQQAKKLLRKTLKMKIKQMSLAEREKESQLVIDKLVQSNYFKNSQRISGEIYLKAS